MLGGWPGHNVSNASAPKRAAAHVNPIPPRKTSKQAKYGDVGQANKARRLARRPKPPVVRPKPKRANQYFNELIRSVEVVVEEDVRRWQQQQQHPQHTVEDPDSHKAPVQQRQQRQEQHEEHQLQVNLDDDGDDEDDEDQYDNQNPVQQSVDNASEIAVATQGRPQTEEDRIRIQIQIPNPGQQPNGRDTSRINPDQDTMLDPNPERQKSSDVPVSTVALKTVSPTPGESTSERTSGPSGFCRTRKLFEDSYDGPHPRMTAKIVARLAACKHWRRPLAHRLLPRYLPLFEQHAAAYFFKHVPSLQPSPPAPSSAANPSSSSPPTSGTINGEAGFRRMVVAVCCSLLPKMPSFGPRALSCMVAGLGRMGISHGPTLVAWQTHSAAQLGLMRPDQLVASLEGLAAIYRSADPQAGATAAAAATTTAPTAAIETPSTTRRWRRLRSWKSTPPPPLDETWRRAALEAAQLALPRMTVAEVGRMLMALAVLRLSPPRQLLDAACTRVRDAVATEAVRQGAAADGVLGGSGRSNHGSLAAGEQQEQQHSYTDLLIIATAIENSAARLAAMPYQYGMIGAAAAGGAVGVLSAAAAAGAAPPTSPGLRKGDHRNAQRGKSQGNRRTGAAAALQPEPVRGADVSRFVRALGVLGYVPSRKWLDWLAANVESVIRVERERARQQRPRTRLPRAGKRRMVPAAATETADVAVTKLNTMVERALPQLGAGTTGSMDFVWTPEGGVMTGRAAAAVASLPYFSTEDLAELTTGLAELMLVMLKPSAAVRAVEFVAQPIAAPGSPSGGPAAAAVGAVPPLPSPLVSAEWLDLVLEAALENIRKRLDVGSAVAAAAAAASASPTAVLTQGDVTKADEMAVAAAASKAAAAATAAADIIPAANCLLRGLLALRPFYKPPRHWCIAAAGLGLELVPYMPPSALMLWLRSIAVWEVLKPLPPAWHAAATIASGRTQLQNYTAMELCDLPRILAAAGARLPASWAAQYLRHLASKLIGSGSRDPCRRRRRWRRQGARSPSLRPLAFQHRGAGSGSVDCGWDGNGKRGLKALAPQGMTVAAAAAPAATAALSLRYVAMALGCLPYVVPDLRYVAEYERDAIQVLVRAFNIYTNTTTITAAGALSRPRMNPKESNPLPQSPTPLSAIQDPREEAKQLETRGGGWTETETVVVASAEADGSTPSAGRGLRDPVRRLEGQDGTRLTQEELRALMFFLAAVGCGSEAT